jgi:surface protein
MNLEWPTDILVHFLQDLSEQCDSNAQRAWHQLAFLTCRRDALTRAAKTMPRPIHLRIEFPGPAQNRFHLRFKIPFVQATLVCVDIDWGDKSVEKLREKGAGYVEHTYASTGEYNVRIFPATGTSASGLSGLDHLGFHSDVQNLDTLAWWTPLREIFSFGRCGLRSLSYLFARSDALNIDARNLSFPEEISDLSGLFFRSTSFNQPIGGWNVSHVTNMSCMLKGAWKFNQHVGNWDVSKVTDMSGLFRAAWAFNQPIGSWNVSNVTNMSGMFFGPSAFNQPIGDWDVGNVTDMRLMFAENLNFNQPIGSWNVSKVTDMTLMFSGAAAFNQPIGDWDISNVTDADVTKIVIGAKSFKQSIEKWEKQTESRKRSK